MRSFKKIAAMIMAVAMLCSFTALAAEVTSVTVGDTTTVANTATVNIASDAAQNTILAYKGTAPAGADVVYIDQLSGTAVAADGVSFQLGTDAADAGTYTVVVGGSDVATAQTATFNHTDATPKYTVAIEEYANGTVSYDADSLVDVSENTVITFTIVPYLGYELTSLMVNEVENVTAVVNGTFELTVAANTIVEPVFAAIAADEGESLTYAEMFDVDAVGDEPESKLTFGQALTKAEAEITSMGMYVQVDRGAGWEDFFTTGDEGYGPEFAAARWTNDYKYGIRFFGFDEGTYKVQSYVRYSDGSVVYGEAIEFTVE